MYVVIDLLSKLLCADFYAISKKTYLEDERLVHMPARYVLPWLHLLALHPNARTFVRTCIPVTDPCIRLCNQIEGSVELTKMCVTTCGENNCGYELAKKIHLLGPIPRLIFPCTCRYKARLMVSYYSTQTTCVKKFIRIANPIYFNVPNSSLSFHDVLLPFITRWRRR